MHQKTNVSRTNNMTDNYDKLFRNLHKIELPQGIYETIISRVHLEMVNKARLQSLLWGSAVFVSLVASIPAINYVHTELTNSGFYQYSSLIYSDGNLFLSNWKEFSLSLIESLPVVGMAMFLVIVALLMEFFKLAIKNMSFLMLQTKLTK